MVPCSPPCSAAFLKQVLSVPPVYGAAGYRAGAVITENWVAGGGTKSVGDVAHRHTAATHSTAVVAHGRHWLPRNGEPAAETAPRFGCAPCNESQCEAEC